MENETAIGSLPPLNDAEAAELMELIETSPDIHTVVEYVNELIAKRG